MSIIFTRTTFNIFTIRVIDNEYHPLVPRLVLSFPISRFRSKSREMPAELTIPIHRLSSRVHPEGFVNTEDLLLVTKRGTFIRGVKWGTRERREFRGESPRLLVTRQLGLLARNKLTRWLPRWSSVSDVTTFFKTIKIER